MEIYIRFYHQSNCAKCPMAKQLVEGSGLLVESYDINDVDGMAMACFHQVLATPTILLLKVDDPEEVPVYEWRGELPTPQEFKAILNRYKEQE